MAREGEHNAQLKVQGDTQSGVKEMRQLAAQMNRFEQSVEKSNTALTKHSVKQKQLDTDITKSGQAFMETRGRVLGFAGAMVGAILAIDRMADRARELNPEVDGLAASWQRMTTELKASGDRLIGAIDKLPLAIRTVRQEMGLLGDGVEEVGEKAEESENFVVSWYKGWFGGLSPLQGEDWLPVRAVNALADAIDDLTLKVAHPRLSTGMDNIARAAKNIEAMGLVKTMERQNAEMERSIEMLEANARAAEIVGQHLERNKTLERSVRRAGRGGSDAVVFGEAFEFSANDIDEMQGGRAADRQALRQNQDEFIEQMRDFNARKRDTELESELERIAMREELGLLDPLDAVAMERDAQLTHIDQLRKTTNDEIELTRLKNREEILYQQAAVRRHELIRQAELKRWATTQEVAAATNQILQGGIGTINMAADMFIASEKRREQAMYVTGGVSALVTGITEQVQAIAAFASFNYVQGALHQAAAIFAFAQSGMLFAKAGGAGQHSSGMSAGGGAMGGGPSMAANGPANGSGGEGLQNQIQSDVPPSQAPTASGPSSSGQQQGGTVIQIGQLNAYATTQEEFIHATARELDYLRRDQRRVS